MAGTEEFKMKKRTALLSFRNLSLRAKLILSTLVVTGLSMAILAFVVYNRTQKSQTTLVNTLQETVREQSEQQLAQILSSEALNADQTLSAITNAVKGMAEYRSALYARQELFSKGDYWDGAERLTQLSGGQYGNSTSDIASVFVPNTISLTESLVAEINNSMYLDMYAPAILNANPNVVAIYFIGNVNYTIYYPNIELASNIPPDFDAVSQPFFTIVNPKNNPDRKAQWTPPYQDPAGTGLIVTSATPVYDQNSRFRGVLAADVQLASISEQISSIKIGKSGFAFLIDPAGRIISMPDAGYLIFELQPETVPVNETPQVTILGRGSANIQAVTSRMVAGEQGVSTVDIQDAPYYMAYTPLPTIGYSLGILVPQIEMDEPFLAARDRITSETQSTLQLAAILLVALMLGAAAVSLFVSQITVRPLTELTSVAEQIAAGNLHVRARADTSDETGVLAKTFNKMTSQLQETLQGLEQRVADRTKDLATVAEISTTTAAIRDPFQMLATMVHLNQRRFNLYHSHVFTYHKESDDLHIVACGYREGDVHEGTHGTAVIPFSQEQSLVARAARTKKPVIVNDVRSDPGWLPNPLLPETRAEMAVPMIVGDDVLGVLDVQADHVDAFTEEDANIQMTLASQIATSYQSALAYEETKEQAGFETLVNLISQKIQRTTTIEDTLQTAIRELGLALGASRVKAAIGMAQKNDGNTVSEN
ncbi:MAG: HAMP domain-containing protein [Anaerolineaceae bacterium]|nr:MAG: HAMP domain-containing protein [Anaerolineaceae bacterium]